jgi:PGF-CTERM protein
MGVGRERGPDVPHTDPGTGTPGGTEDGQGQPALYVFPDPLAGPTENPTRSPTDVQRTTDGVGASGPGFGPLAALAGLGSAALGLRARSGED